MIKHRLCTLALSCGLAATGLSAQTSSQTNSQTTNHTTATRPATPSASSTTPGTQAGSTTATTGTSSQAQAQTPPAHPITTAQTREMFELMGYKKLMDNMLNQTIAMQKQQAPFVPADVWTDFQNSFSNIDYVSLLQPIYAKYISEEEAAKSLEFYRTPAGRHMLESMPMLMRDIMVASQQNGQKIGHEVIERHRAEIEAAQKKYQQEQQGNTPGASGAGAGAGAGSGAGAGAGTSHGTTSGAPSTTTPPANGTQTTPPAGSSTTTPKPPQK